MKEYNGDNYYKKANSLLRQGYDFHSSSIRPPSEKSGYISIKADGAYVTFKKVGYDKRFIPVIEE